MQYEHAGVRQDVLLSTGQKNLAALKVGAGTRNSCLPERHLTSVMTKRTQAKEDRLTHPVRTRVTKAVFERLIEVQKNSSCQTIGEVARKILSREKILCFHKDITMNAPMKELTSIRKELKAIGININQQTKYFHTSDNDAQRAFYVLKTAELYKGVDVKVERLLTLVSQLTEKWLQK